MQFSLLTVLESVNDVVQLHLSGFPTHFPFSGFPVHAPHAPRAAGSFG